MIEQIGDSPELAKAAWSLKPETPLAGPFEIAGSYVVVRLKDRKDPDPREWEKKQGDLRRDAELAKWNEVFTTWVKSRCLEAKGAGRITVNRSLLRYEDSQELPLRCLRSRGSAAAIIAVRAQAPTDRPTWVLILSSVMLLAGGYSLVAGLLKLRDPTVVLSVGMTDVAGSDAAVQLNRRLAAARAAAVLPHLSTVRTEATLEVVLALFTLYATAAIVSRDRHGRALALGVGALGIIYQVGTLPVYLSLMHDYAERSSDLLAQVILQSAGQTSTLTPAEIAGRLHSAIVGGPILVAAVGVLGSLVLFAFFGGRRGRALYGMDGPPSTRPGG